MPEALALLATGSLGLEPGRLDRYSDLDLLLVCRSGTDAVFLDDPCWIGRVHTVGYCFRFNADCIKLLFDDGVFCELAVMDPTKLAALHFPGGRVLWKADDFDESLCTPADTGAAPPISAPDDWVINELLTTIHIGLSKYARGEWLSGFTYIHNQALPLFMELVSRHYMPVHGVSEDPYTKARRFESRYPGIETELKSMLQGYERTRESALAMLAWLDRIYTVNPLMKVGIVSLCGEV
jgi:hypothetical protein